MKWQYWGAFAALSLAACGQPGAANADRVTSAADVCQRTDVQDAVSKEVRGIIVKNALPQLLMDPTSLVDSTRFSEAMEKADVTFSRVGLGKGADGAGSSIACAGSVKIDASNALAGQDVVQIKRLMWHVNFADGDGDLSSSNFTVEVDQDSIFRGMAINGRSAQSMLEEEQASEQPPADDASEAVQAASDAAVAAADAEQAAKHAQVEAENAGNEPTSDGSEPARADLNAPPLH